MKLFQPRWELSKAGVVLGILNYGCNFYQHENILFSGYKCCASILLSFETVVVGNLKWKKNTFMLSEY